MSDLRPLEEYVPDKYKDMIVYDRRDGGMCPIDPLYCSRFYDHACFNADSFTSGYVVYGKQKPNV